MGLQIVAGASGTGKSYNMYQDIVKESKVNPEKNFFIIVPEQFTLQTQKNIVNTSPQKGILNIDVLSFMRLAYRIFDELGKKNNVVLEDTGKNMIIRKVIELKKDELNIFKGSIRKQGFISEVKSLISELYQYSVTPEELEKITSELENNNRLKYKFQEILIVYKAFKEYLADKYITAEEILDILYEIVDESAIIKNSVLYLDGFTGFTPVQYKLLAKLLKLCDRVVVTVTLDEKEVGYNNYNEYTLFGMSHKTIQKLITIARDNHVEIHDTKVIKRVEVDGNYSAYRFSTSKALSHLEQNVFRYPYSKFYDEQNDIKIYALPDVDKETELVIKEIKKIVSDKGYRYRDFAIITGDMNSYGRVFENKFRRENIPCFIDNKKDIMDNPIIEMIAALFEIAATNFSYESVFRYLRCGMSNLTIKEIDILENYVIALGKKGINAWKKEWDRTYSTRANIDIISINEYRERVCDELLDAVKVIKKCKTIKDYSQAVYSFMVNLDCEKKLQEYADSFETNGNSSKAKEYNQVYREIIELLDKMVDLLSEEQVSLKEYSDIFQAGVAEIKVGIIPLTIDQVVVGDIERTRLNDIKVLFFVGVNDGIIPKSNNGGGLISDLDREMLADMGVELAPTGRQSTYIEQFYLYMALTKPQNALYVTFSRMSGDGKINKESYIVNKILKIFPNININNNEDDILKNDYGMDYLISGLREKKIENMDDAWKQILVWHLSDDTCKKEFRSIVDGAYYVSANSNISKAAASAIYGNKDKSVTEIEKYASCAYAHFLQYGLKLYERTEYEIRVPDLGNIFHGFLDRFSNGIKTSGYTWSDITDEERIKLSDKCVEETVAEFGNNIMYSSKRNEYLVERIKRIASRTTWALCEHVRAGEFKPEGFEVSFSSKDGNIAGFELDDGRKLGIRGAIDRIDISEDDDNEYVKVIDYKSGSRSFEPGMFYEGIQLQLIVYMNVAVDKRKGLNKQKNIVPAGVFYYTIDDPIVDKTNDMVITSQDGNLQEHVLSSIDEKKLDKLVMKGIINKNPEVIKRIERALVSDDGKLIAKKTSKVVKASVATSGELKKTSNGISTEDFKALREYASMLIKNNSEKMYKGIIKPVPYKSGNNSACEYCNYKSICKFDIKFEGNNYKKIYSKDMDTVLKMIKGGEEGGESKMDNGPAESN